LIRLFEKAAAQFEAVNPARTALNVLAFVNHKHGANYADLRELITGYFFASSGARIPTMRPHEKAKEVDLYLWFDGRTGFMSGAVVNQTDPERMDRACALFGVNPAAIR
jgi:hypothetical protein